MNLRASKRNGLPGRTDRSRERGVMLVECLLYIALLAIFLEFAFGAFYAGFQQSNALKRNAEDITRAVRVGELWREEVRDSIAAPALEAGKAGHVLTLHSRSGEIRFVFATNAVWRVTGNGGRRELFLKGVRSSRMFADQRRNVTAWCWELELNPVREKVHVRPLFTFQAVAASAPTP